MDLKNAGSVKLIKKFMNMHEYLTYMPGTDIEICSASRGCVRNLYIIHSSDRGLERSSRADLPLDCEALL